jgi:hypothetical protein
MAGLFRAAGWSVRVRDPADLIIDCERLRDARDGAAIDIVLRYYLLADPGASVVQRAHDEGQVLLVDPPRPHGNKGLLELVEDPAVPWTRVLCDRSTTDQVGRRIDLLSYAEHHQTGLVIKPSNSFGGRGVLIGSQVDPAIWRERLDVVQREYCEGKRFIVQQRLVVPQERVPLLEVGLPVAQLYYDRNPVLCDGKFVGFTTRLSPDMRTGAAQRSSWVPAFMLGQA